MTDKLSYDIIGLVALIDQVKRAAEQSLRNEQQIADTIALNDECNNNPVTSDINERLSEPGLVPSGNDSLIITSGCSGFEPLTNLVNQNGFGNLTAALQVQGGVLMFLMIILLMLIIVFLTLLQCPNHLSNALPLLYAMIP